MGTLYSIVALDDKSRRWLLEEGLDVPEEDGAFPSPVMLKLAFDKLENIKVKYRIGLTKFEATITDDQQDQWTTLQLSTPNEVNLQGYFFKGGHPQLMLRILQHVARSYGPVVVVPDSGCLPVIINGDSAIDEILERWNHSPE